MTEMLTAHSNGGPPDKPRQPSYAAVMKTTAELYGFTLSTEFLAAKRAVDEVKDLLVREGDSFRPVPLPIERADRFKLHCRAYDAIDQIPIRSLADAKSEISRAIHTKPLMPERCWLMGTMLNILGIRAGDDTDGYIEALAFELGNFQPDRSDWHLGLPTWVPSYAIAHGVRRICTLKRGENYGRPPPIWEVLEKCRESRVVLHRVLQEINQVGRSWKFLKKIVQATEDSYPPEDIW